MMILHSLTVSNVRAIDHLHLEKLPETGVIVIHGNNEEGKSTILDALDAVLNIKYNSAAKPIKSLKPVDRDVSPEVSATMTVGPVTFRIAKRWLKKKEAELTVTAPTRENHTGGDAEERLAEILREHLDADLLRTLFLRQEDLGGAIQAAGIATLSNALASAHTDGADGPVDASDDDELMRAVDQEYLRYFTRRGDQSNSVKKSVQDWTRSVEELDDATAELERLQNYVDQVAVNEAERDRGEAQLPEALAALESAEEGLSTARATQEKATAARADHERAARDLETARQAVADRARRRSELEELRAQATAMDAEVDAAREAADLEEERLRQLREELETARSSRTAARERLAQASATQRRAADEARRAELQSLLGTLEELDTRIAALRARTSGRQITDADVRAVEEAANEVAIAEALRQRAVPKLELSAATATTVTVDGAEAALGADPHSVDLAEGTEITIGEVTAIYRAGEGGGADAVRRAEQAAEALDSLLTGLDCDSADQARAARDQATKFAEELASAQRERTALLAGRDAEALRGEAARLDRELGETGAETTVDAEDIAAAVAQAQEESESLEAEISRLEQAMTPWQEGTAAKKHVEIATRLDQLNTQIGAADATLEQLEETQSQEALAAAVTVAAEQLKAREQSLAEAEQAVAAADPEHHEALVEAASSRVTSIQSRVKSATLTLATLSGRIDQAAGAAERVQKASAREGRLRRHVEQLDSRAAAAQRLREVLVRHRATARARYAQPFADELTTLASAVFGPQVQFTLSEDLEVTQRTVGDVTVPLEALSGGAKEQLAILTRFAIAGLVGRGGDGAGEHGSTAAPVIVDDALGATDPQRLQLMNTLFTRLGRQTQVLVLTCFPSRYDWVAGKTEYSMTQLKTAR